MIPAGVTDDGRVIVVVLTSLPGAPGSAPAEDDGSSVLLRAAAVVLVAWLAWRLVSEPSPRAT